MWLLRSKGPQIRCISTIKLISLTLSPEASHYHPCKIWTFKKCPPLQNMSLAVKFTQTENVDNFSLFILRSSARYLCVFYLPGSVRD